jgi:hypothetical protein
MLISNSGKVNGCRQQMMIKRLNEIGILRNLDSNNLVTLKLCRFIFGIIQGKYANDLDDWKGKFTVLHMSKITLL